MNALNILHLSDLHIGNFKYDDAPTLAITIANTLQDQGRTVEIILVSGDIFDGRSRAHEKDRKFAIKFFDALISQINNKALSALKLTRDEILFVPGNHDLVRSETDPYKRFDDFLNEFYPSKSSSRVTMVDGYNFICDFPEKKIAILGFNSCRIEIEQLQENDLDWIEKIDLDEFKAKKEVIRKKIKDYKAQEIKWDDYGYIDPLELDNVFTTLREIIPGHSDYNLLATFHHHFYPFPEMSKAKQDRSFIRNYTAVMDQFQRYKIRMVLHGHKHLPIQRALTDNRYFDDPDSIIYVLAAGSVGHRDVYNPSFHWLRVLSGNSARLADGERYTFKDEEFDMAKPFILPPPGKEEKGFAESLLPYLEMENSDLYQKYQDLTNDFEQLVLDSQIGKVIELVGNLFTIFPDIKLELRRNPKLNYLLLLSLNFRVVYLRNIYKPNTEQQDLLDKLCTAIIDTADGSDFIESLMIFLKAKTNSELERAYNNIIKNVSNENKRIGAYCSIALFMADLFLNISSYGEFYFEKEKLNHKINVNLVTDAFYRNIPSDSIEIEANVDRRAVLMRFKSKDPTVHKVAVLIIKDFEMRLDKFEESLKEIKLKLYYIIPKIQAEKYDLENFHFDAYIPTLLPLLTGDNLYKSKEVFIRELIQNSIDATLLRKQVDQEKDYLTDIKIVLGAEKRNGGNVKYFKIMDNGIGMSKFTIERYFTSIGRSYYVSEEFDELKKDKKIQYEAISNFGIGFLSSFMVCKEVNVQTRNVFPDDEIKGLEIEIPNYDGCFFIRKTDKEDVGTEITLFEDERKLFNFKKFTDYMDRTLINLPLSLKIHNSLAQTSFEIQSFSLHREMLRLLKESTHPVFYVPFSEKEKESYYQSWESLSSSSIDDIEKFGVWVDFSKVDNLSFQSKKENITCLNQGLLVSTPFLPFKLKKNDLIPHIKINYPSSFIQLDVSRERILKLKDSVDLKNILKHLQMQIVEFLQEEGGKASKMKLADLYGMQLVIRNEFKNFEEARIDLEAYTLRLEDFGTNLGITICKIKSIPDSYDENKICFISHNYSLGRSIKFLSRVIQNLPGSAVTDKVELKKQNDFIKESGLSKFFKQIETNKIIRHEGNDRHMRISVEDMIYTYQSDHSEAKYTYEMNFMGVFSGLRRYESFDFVKFFHILITRFYSPVVERKMPAELQHNQVLIVLSAFKAAVFNILTPGDVAGFTLKINYIDMIVSTRQEVERDDEQM